VSLVEQLNPRDGFHPPLANDSLLKNALAADCVILSSVGKHAQQGWQTIIDRKRRDIANVGHTLWVTNSQAAAPQIVQTFSHKHCARHVIFVAKVRKDPGSQTKFKDPAQFFSPDNRTWRSLPPSLSEVTGRITRVTTGFCFDALSQITSGTLKLDEYVKDSDDLPLTKFTNINSAYPVRRAKDENAVLQYEILAVGQLAYPYAVWLRK
jgi:hypothetical protein